MIDLFKEAYILSDQHTSIVCIYKPKYTLQSLVLKNTILCPVESEASFIIGSGSAEIGKPLPILQVVAS